MRRKLRGTGVFAQGDYFAEPGVNNSDGLRVDNTTGRSKREELPETSYSVRAMSSRNVAAMRSQLGDAQCLADHDHSGRDEQQCQRTQLPGAVAELLLRLDCFVTGNIT
jgi:hypothetical protein